MMIRMHHYVLVLVRMALYDVFFHMIMMSWLMLVAIFATLVNRPSQSS